MIVALLLGTGAGCGLLLLGRALRPRPVPLGVAVRRLEARNRAPRPGGVRVGRGTRSAVQGAFADRLVCDLRVIDRDPDRHVVDKLGTGLALGALPIGGGSVLAMAGLQVPWLVIILMAAAGLLGGYWLPDGLVRRQAAARRRQFTFSLSSYLDLVNVLLAGGAGIETALHATAQTGDGWAFHELNNALVRATTMRRSPWAALAELGEELGVAELVELAASVQLAGEEGARIRSSLAAKAASLRGRQLAQIEADAHSASERMGFPTVAMFLGFLALLAYPAVQQIAGS